MFLSQRTSTTPYHSSIFFFFNDTATTEIYTLSLHDALPICSVAVPSTTPTGGSRPTISRPATRSSPGSIPRSEEHTSELQSRLHLVCRLLLEKKKKKRNKYRQRNIDRTAGDVRQ